MSSCVICGAPALYLDLRLGGMACTQHAAADIQVAALRSLTSALLKAMVCEQMLDGDHHAETRAIVERLRPLLKD